MHVEALAPDLTPIMDLEMWLKSTQRQYLSNNMTFN